MEPVKHREQHTRYQLGTNLRHSIKPLAKFLASILFCSLVFSCSSLLPFVVNYKQFFSSNTVKNYMFLLCNGILAALVKNSGLFSNSPEGSNFNGDVKAKNGNNPKKVDRLLDIKEAVVAEEKAPREVKGMEKMEDSSLINVGEEEDRASLIGQDEVAGQGNGIADPDEEREEEAIEFPSAEELNEKCENFIRKMKERIKLEAQQLVVVHHQ